MKRNKSSLRRFDEPLAVSMAVYKSWLGLASSALLSSLIIDKTLTTIILTTDWPNKQKCPIPNPQRYPLLVKLPPQAISHSRNLVNISLTNIIMMIYCRSPESPLPRLLLPLRPLLKVIHISPGSVVTSRARFRPRNLKASETSPEAERKDWEKRSKGGMKRIESVFCSLLSNDFNSPCPFLCRLLSHFLQPSCFSASHQNAHISLRHSL